MSQATTHAIVSKSSVQLTFAAKPVQMLTNTPTFNVCTYPLNHDVAKKASCRALFRRVSKFK